MDKIDTCKEILNADILGAERDHPVGSYFVGVDSIKS